MRDILLSQYKPKSTLRGDTHEIIKPRFKVFDIHTHMGSLLPGGNYENKYDTCEYLKILEYYDVETVVNLDGNWGQELDRMLSKTKGYEDRIITFGWVDITGIDEFDFGKKVEASIKEGYKKGIRGIKIWKNISLGQKDKTGKYVRIDDKRLNPVWNTAAELDIPILIHIADPIAFFEKVDEYNERFEVFNSYPEWSFYDPKFYRFEELMEMQEAMLFNNPHTTFIIAHFGSAAEDLKFAARCLDTYPNMYIDTAERIFDLGRQPYSTRDFFLKYPDRILFGTDHFPTKTPLYDIYYRFFETRDEYFDYDKNEIPFCGRWKIYGIYLPDEVLKKVYYENAEKLVLKKFMITETT